MTTTDYVYAAWGLYVLVLVVVLYRASTRTERNDR